MGNNPQIPNSSKSQTNEVFESYDRQPTRHNRHDKYEVRKKEIVSDISKASQVSFCTCDAKETNGQCCQRETVFRCHPGFAFPEVSDFSLRKLSSPGNFIKAYQMAEEALHVKPQPPIVEEKHNHQCPKVSTAHGNNLEFSFQPNLFLSMSTESLETLHAKPPSNTVFERHSDSTRVIILRPVDTPTLLSITSLGSISLDFSRPILPKIVVVSAEGHILQQAILQSPKDHLPLKIQAELMEDKINNLNEIIDLLNRKISLLEFQKPMEVLSTAESDPLVNSQPSSKQ